MNRSTPRIVSLLPAATEMVCGIGLRDHLVGVSHECNWPPGVEALPRLTRSRVDSLADSASIDAEVKRLVAAGEALYEVDAALLAELRPDLIVTQAQCDVCAVSYQSVARLVAACAELAHAQLLALNPRSIEEVLSDILRIGALAGSAQPASEWVNELRARIEAVRQAAANRSRRPRIAVIEWVEPLMAAGNWTPELVELAGGEYGLATAGEPSPYLSWHAFRRYAPEIIVVAPCGFNQERSEREAARLPSLPGWCDLPAAVSGHVFVVDGDALFNRPGPRLVDSLEFMRNRITAL